MRDKENNGAQTLRPEKPGVTPSPPPLNKGAHRVGVSLHTNLKPYDAIDSKENGLILIFHTHYLCTGVDIHLLSSHNLPINVES